MEDYSQYDHTDDDPYLNEGSGCLQNLLGITNTGDLNIAEQEITQVTLADLAIHPEPASFDLDHLQRIHRRLFDQIYPFAGMLRQVEFGKGGSLFLPFRLIEVEAKACFLQLNHENLLAGLDAYAFGTRAGFYLGWINKIHPFREGNGRAQRVLIDQLADRLGYAIEWSAVSGDAMAAACREARTTDPHAHKLARLLALNTVSIQAAN